MTPETIRRQLMWLKTDADNDGPCPACGDPTLGHDVIPTEYGPVHWSHDERTILRYALTTSPHDAHISMIDLGGLILGTVMWHADGRSTVLDPTGHTFARTDADWLDAGMRLWGLTE